MEVFDERKNVFLQNVDISRMLLKVVKILEVVKSLDPFTDPCATLHLAMHLQVKHATGVSRDHYLSITSAGQRRLGKMGSLR